jgi:hypothetical protein
MEISWTDVGSGGYMLVSCAHSNTSLILLLNMGYAILNMGQENTIKKTII